jgi:hypothetical protein
MLYNNPVRRRSKKHTRHSKRPGTISPIFKLLKRDPIKFIGILFIVILIYITILFFLYDKKQKASKLNPYLEKSNK